MQTGHKLRGIATADCSLIYPCGLDPGCTFPGPAVAEVHRVFTAITARLIDAFGHGPAGRKHPAMDNPPAAADARGHTRAGDPVHADRACIGASVAEPYATSPPTLNGQAGYVLLTAEPSAIPASVLTIDVLAEQAVEIDAAQQYSRRLATSEWLHGQTRPSGPWAFGTPEGVLDLKDVVHHADRGSRYTSIRFTGCGTRRRRETLFIDLAIETPLAA